VGFFVARVSCRARYEETTVHNNAAEIAKLFQPLKRGTGFTGRSPGGKRRWTGKFKKMIRDWQQSLAPHSAVIRRHGSLANPLMH
jgi:hypothetical protein